MSTDTCDIPKSSEESHINYYEVSETQVTF